MITCKEIAKKTMTEEKKEEAKHDLFSFYIGRPLTYLLTIPFLYTSITPNTVTFISIVMSIVGFVLCCFVHTKSLLLLAWFFFFMWSMFDGVDGNIARYRKQYSKLGTVYDTMGGYIAIMLMFFGAGIAASHTHCYFDKFLTINKELYIILGGLSSLLDILPRLMMHYMKSTLGDINNFSRISDKKNYGLVEKIALNVTSPSGGAMILWAVGVLFNILDVFTIGYFFVNTMKMIVSLYSMFSKVEKGNL